MVIVTFCRYYIHVTGYALDQTRSNCTDIDECANPESCKFGECVNKLGSFECNCPPGFELLASGDACIGKLWHEGWHRSMKTGWSNQ